MTASYMRGLSAIGGGNLIGKLTQKDRIGLGTIPASFTERVFARSEVAEAMRNAPQVRSNVMSCHHTRSRARNSRNRRFAEMSACFQSFFSL